MGAHPKRRFWRICRICFRTFRIAVWLTILALLVGLIYLNQIGLPDFVKAPLLQRLQARGIDLQFSRLRLRWYQGIAAENVHFGPADQELSPHLNVAEVRVQLNWHALTRLQLQVDSLTLRQGRVSWDFGETNRFPQALSVTDIQTDLRFLPDDRWALDHFKARFAGANILLSGLVTNASAIRDWKIFQGGQPASQSAKLWQGRLRRLEDTLGRIHFSVPPELRVDVRGNALDLQSFNVLLALSAPGAETPWGTVSQGRFNARLFSVDTNGLAHAEVDIRAGAAKTRWAAITNFLMKIRLDSVKSQAELVHGELTLSAGQVQTEWASGSNAVFSANWVHSITNPIPISGQGSLGCDFAQTSWASAGDIHLQGSLAPASAANRASPNDAAWAWWTNLQPYQLSWDCQLANFKSSKLVSDRITCAGDWQPPRLTITNFDAALFEGQLAAQAHLDVDTRTASLSVASSFDPRRLGPLVPESAQRVLNELAWPKAPKVNADLLFTLPPWTNREPDWRAEIQPTLQLRGELGLEGGGSYRRVQVASLHSHFIYSNLCWYLPDITLTRPEGRLEAEHRANDVTKDFYWHLSSTIDPTILRPLLDESAQRGFDLLTFSQPPAVEAEIWGRLSDAEHTGLRGQLFLTNFTFRGEAFTDLQTQVQYTNRSLRFIQPHVGVGNRHVKADGVVVDVEAQLVYVTNGFSTAEPMVVARAIGPQIAKAIEDYSFSSPPTARVYGIIPLHGEEAANLHFDLAGGPFHWWKFNVPQIAGHVHWAGLHLTLTNVQSDFYYGKALGWAAFDFPRGRGTEFQFALNATNVLLQSLMADLSTRTNHLEGRLSGTLVVTKADADSWQSVFGYGDAHLRDGLLWDVPVFGIFSPILNGIAPGMGNSRASAATAGFIITNGVIRTSDLEIRSTAMRLQYRGTVNLESQVNARVDAELLRNMWLVGPVVSTVLWPVTKLFEYRVTGDLADPKSEVVGIIPKIMLMPLHPFRTLKGMVPEDPNSNPNFSPLPP
jgi:hypothetical protein